MITLAIGVGIAVALSVIRFLIPELQLWQYLLPGYIISIALSYLAPKLFVGIAFDSGGVASGPMTATFIWPITQGAAEAVEGANVLVDGFGVIAMVAMTPLIALQILGLILRLNPGKEDLKIMDSKIEPMEIELISVIVNLGMGSKILKNIQKAWNLWWNYSISKGHCK
jgi:hypothetical protein